MPIKLKPSTKDYIRDSRGKMTNKWVWKHYTTTNTSTEELLCLPINNFLPAWSNAISPDAREPGVELEALFAALLICMVLAIVFSYWLSECTTV